MTATDISIADFFTYISTGKKADSQSKAGKKKRRTQAEATDQCGHASSEGFLNPCE